MPQNDGIIVDIQLCIMLCRNIFSVNNYGMTGFANENKEIICPDHELC